MAVNSENELKILRFFVKGVLKREKISLNEVPRMVGSMVHDSELDRLEIVEVIGNLYKEVVTESFDPKNFKGGH